ncbi:MAG: SPOR domain-containing protein [Acidobacteria bacterium]|nr:SPOR domain-containing protein [Acidobacteriota bacterium]
MKFSPFLIVVLLLLAVPVYGQTARFTVQLEASPALDVAQEKVKKLRESGVEAYIVRSEVPGKGTFYRVRVGIFDSLAEAKKFGAVLQNQRKIRDFYAAPYERPQADLIGIVKEQPKPVEPVKVQPKPIVKETAPVKTESKTANIAVTNPPAATAKPTPNPGVESIPGKAAVSTPVKPVTPATPATPGFNLVRFQDATVGFSFERPQAWEGGPLDSKEIQDQKVNAGAFFKSYQDSAFINAIWNNLEKANSPENDNDLIVELIIKSMASGDGTEQMLETARKVVSENGVIKTYIDLNARFKTQGQDAPLDFLGKAVIVRAGKGILLVVTFYSKNGPPHVSGLADRIIASVQAP